MPLEPTATGLLARAGEYEPLRAFSQGGRYWDRVPQQLIREGALAEFLPAVEAEEDDRGRFGRFHRTTGRREWLRRSLPVGRRGVPAPQLERLRQAVREFSNQAAAPGAQPQNRELIERFQLPDITRDPDLYRLAGPWWNRRLQILWGCERTPDSSLPAGAAVEKLEEDRFYSLRRLLTALLLSLLLLLLLLPMGWLWQIWPQPLNLSGRQALPTASPVPGRRSGTEAAGTGAASPPSAANRGGKPFQPTGHRPAAGLPKAQYAGRIVLCGQGQPEADGKTEVTLEVRTPGDPPRKLPVEAWHFDGQTVRSQDRLHARMAAGEHPIQADILDPAGGPAQISAVVTIEPGKVVTTPGSVRVRQ
jgi:hypothetical protein